MDMRWGDEGMRVEKGWVKGERKTSDSLASSKRSDSATGSPLTPSGDNMWPIICVFHFAGEKRDPKVHKTMKKSKQGNMFANQQLSPLLPFLRLGLKRMQYIHTGPHKEFEQCSIHIIFGVCF